MDPLFSVKNWKNAKEENVHPFTIITLQDIKNGNYVAINDEIKTKTISCLEKSIAEIWPLIPIGLT